MKAKDFAKIYYDLTGVNVEEQKMLWDERGKGYYGEYLVFIELFENIPGCNKLLMNLEIPTGNDSTTEIDCLMIHETGIYVFEVKYHKGTIYGTTDDETWTQYFRTKDNHTFKNPLLQNAYHIQALKRFMPGIPMHSIVVFANDDCDVRVDTKENVCDLYQLPSVLGQIFKNSERVLYLEDIEDVFQGLKPYSKIQEETMLDKNGEEVEFYDYIDSIREFYDQLIKTHKKEHRERLQELDDEKIITKKKRKSDRLKCICVSVLIILGSLLFFNYTSRTSIAESEKSCEQQIKIMRENMQTQIGHAEMKVEKMTLELEEMKQKFNRVDLSDENNRKMTKDMIKVESSLKKVSDLEDVVEFSCKLINTAEEYGIGFSEDTAYVIMMTDGTVHEYNMFGERLSYWGPSQKIYGTSVKYVIHEKTLKNLEIYNIKNKNDIQWIKLTNVYLFKSGDNNGNALVKGLELELYSK